jgi:hypothetical protein
MPFDSLSDKLKSKIDLLKELWPELIVQDIVPQDYYTTEGASDGAKYKICIYKDSVFLGTIYVFVETIMIDSDKKFLLKEPIKQWISKVNKWYNDLYSAPSLANGAEVV